MNEMTQEEYIKELAELYEIAKRNGQTSLARTLLEEIYYYRTKTKAES